MNKNKSGVSVIVCAYNEGENIGPAIGSVTWAMKKTDTPYEILVMADGCTDGTVKAAKRKAGKDKHIKVIDLGKHQGLGLAMRKGIELSIMEYLTVFPGDNDLDPVSLIDLTAKKEAADLVIGYLGKSDRRGLLRRIASLVYVAFVNKLFGMNIQYYNGPFICKTELVKKLNLVSAGFTIFAEMKIKLLNSGAALEEIPFNHKGRVHGQSKAVKLSSISDSVISTFRIWWEEKRRIKN